MVKRVLIFLVGLVFVCAHQIVFAKEIKYTIIPESPRPGEPITIGVNGVVKEALLFKDDKQVSKSVFFTVTADSGYPSFMAAIITIPSTVEHGDAVIKLNSESGVSHEIPITIAPREFRSETLTLNPSLTSLVADPNPQRTIESEQLWAIIARTGNRIYHTGPFILPVLSTRRTSQFGTRRINAYSDGRRVTSIHAGVDFGIPTGTEVYACGRGRIVLSRNRILSGYSVIIEHAPGVYSMYYHLDSLLVKEGDIVDAGRTIGFSGSTGFSTGPHLHWEIRVSTENTDPDALTERPLIDKELIISRLFN
jgi:murein DD-endopeptidase MepM/ murein hydrolase activator NlpD